MNDVQFDEPTYKSVRVSRSGNVFSKFLIDKKIAKNQQQATHILLSIVIVSVIVSIFLITKSNTSINNPTKELINAKQPIGGSMINVK